MEDKAKKDTRFQKGVSGNPNGRPEGSRNKAMSDAQLAKKLSEGSVSAMNVLRNKFQSEDDKVALRAALAWITLDIDLRKLAYAKVRDEANSKGGKGNKPKATTPNTPVLTLTKKN